MEHSGYKFDIWWFCGIIFVKGQNELESLSLNIISTPSSNAVSSGPKITAFQRRTLSGQGAPETPWGASWESRLKSLLSNFFKIPHQPSPGI